MNEPERMASELMADLHNNRLMTTVDLDGAANRIKDAIEQAITSERDACAKIADALAAEPWGHSEQGTTCDRIAAAIRARGQT